MANYYLHVGSITNAMRGKKMLEARGIRPFLHKSSNPEKGDGCGYSLLVSGDVGQAKAILQQGGVTVRRVSDAL